MRRFIPIIVSLSVLALAVFIRTEHYPVIEGLKFNVFDTFQQSKPRPYSPQPVRIIDIDDESLKRYGQWPWPRTIMADLVKKLDGYGAATISFDVVFAEADRTSPKYIIPLWQQNELLDEKALKKLPDHDTLFAEAISKTNVVTGFVLTHNEKHTGTPLSKAGFAHSGHIDANPKNVLESFSGAITTLDIFSQAAKGNGSFNSSPDSDGIIRKIDLAMTYKEQYYPTLIAESLRVAQGAGTYTIFSAGSSGDDSGAFSDSITKIRIGDLMIPTDSKGKLWLYYSEYIPERYVPAWQILEGSVDPALIEGHIVLLGTSAQGLRDIRATPLNPTANGVEVHAQALEQIISGEYLQRPDTFEGLEIIIMIIVGLVLIIFMELTSALWGALFTALALSSAFGFSWIMFDEKRLLIDPITPSLAILLLYFSSSLSRYMATEKEKRQVRNAFSHYMSPVLVQQLAKNPDALKLGGENKKLTLMFSDIRGFTGISEKFTAEELTSFINQFLTPMTDIILTHKGTIDKYMGDCIMAFWNAPLDDEQHAENACIASLQMIQALEKFNIEQEQLAKQANKEHIPIRIGIGLNTGDCNVGNMGSEQRFDYSVLGDSVNLASRLEGQSKFYGVDIIIGEDTQKDVLDYACIELDRIQVKGKTEAVTIYALLGDKDMRLDPQFDVFKNTYSRMLDYYRGQKWTNAKSQLDVSQKEADKAGLNLNTLHKLYAERIAHFKKHAPEKDWNGVYKSENK